ncbi:MAG: hypothetical protein MUC49_16730 [Raineya sp.]|jgi:hypothetical protein|nr:hypothetical protein [Raineya sp.]
MKWILFILCFFIQNQLIAQESQSRSGEVNNSHLILNIDTTNTLQSPKVVVLKEQALNNQNTTEFLEKKPHQASKRFFNHIQTLKNRKINSSPEKKVKKNDFGDITIALGVIFLIFAFFFLIRFTIVSIWFFFIFLVITIIGTTITLSLLDDMRGKGRIGQFGGAIIMVIFGIPTLIFGYIPMFFSLFGYLAYLWNAFALFNIIGLICLGLSLIFFSLHLFFY